MEERARVVSTDGNIAKVTLKRSSACGESCAQCKGGCAPGNTYVEVKNLIGARVGQEVVIEMKTGIFMSAVLITYVFPLIMLFIGIAIGASFNPPFGLSLSKDSYGLILGFSLMIVSYAVASMIDKKYKRSGKVSFTLTKIIDK